MTISKSSLLAWIDEQENTINELTAMAEFAQEQTTADIAEQAFADGGLDILDRLRQFVRSC